MKRYSNSLVFREIKTKTRQHFILIRMQTKIRKVVIQNAGKNIQK